MRTRSQRVEDSRPAAAVQDAFKRNMSRSLALQISRAPNDVLLQVCSSLLQALISDLSKVSVHTVRSRIEMLGLYFDRVKNSSLDRSKKIDIYRIFGEYLMTGIHSVQRQNLNKDTFFEHKPTSKMIDTKVMDALLIPIISDDVYGLGFITFGYLAENVYTEPVTARNDCVDLFSKQNLYKKYYRGYGWQRH